MATIERAKQTILTYQSSKCGNISFRMTVYWKAPYKGLIVSKLAAKQPYRTNCTPKATATVPFVLNGACKDNCGASGTTTITKQTKHYDFVSKNDN